MSYCAEKLLATRLDVVLLGETEFKQDVLYEAAFQKGQLWLQRAAVQPHIVTAEEATDVSPGLTDVGEEDRS